MKRFKNFSCNLVITLEIAIIASINLTLISNTAATGTQSHSIGAKISNNTNSRNRSSKPHVCLPDLSCIRKESLPEWFNLSDTYLTQIKVGAQFDDYNPIISIRISQLIESYLWNLKNRSPNTAEKGEGASLSLECALRTECVKTLNILATDIKNDAEFIDSCFRARNRVCASKVEQTKINLKRWLRKTRTAIEAIINYGTKV